MQPSILQYHFTGTKDDLPTLALIGQEKISLPESGLTNLVNDLFLTQLDQIVNATVSENSYDIRLGLSKIKNQRAAEEIGRQNRIILEKFMPFRRYLSQWSNNDDNYVLNLHKVLKDDLGKLKTESQRVRFVIGKLAAEKAVEGHPSYLYLFLKEVSELQLEDPQLLVELVKFCMSLHPHSTMHYFSNFQIKDPKSLLELAKFCAQENGNQTAKIIDQFQITDTETLIEIAKLCIQKYSIAEYITNFQIRDPKTLIELAILCAQKNGGRTAAYIKNFHIEDPKILIEIAILCAQNDGGGTAAHIENFHIEDPKILIEIAKLCAKQDGYGTVQYFKNFQIKDQEISFEIAKLCAQENGFSAEYIKNFTLSEEQSKIILTICLSECPKSIEEISKLKNHPIFGQVAIKLDPEKREQLLKEINSYISEKCQSIEGLSKACLEPLQSLLTPIDTETFASLPSQEKTKKIEEALLPQTKKLDHLIPLLLMMEYRLPIEAWPKILHLFRIILNTRRPDLHWSLLAQTFQLAVEDPNSKALASKEEGWIIILKILSERLIKEGYPQDKVNAIVERVSKSKAFRDGKNHQSIHEALTTLLEKHQFDKKAKISLFDKLFGSLPLTVKKDLTRNELQILGDQLTQFLIRVRQFTSLLLIASPSLLSEPSEESISHLLERAFSAIVPLGTMENFGEKYLKTFIASRNPTAFFNYAGKLHSLHDKTVLSDLSNIVTAILNNRWSELRHDTSKSNHLKKIEEKHGAVLQKWNTSCEDILLSKIKVTATQETFSYLEWLHQKLVLDTHMGEIIHQDSTLFALLNAKSAIDQKNLREMIRTKLPAMILINRVATLLSATTRKEEISLLKDLLKLPEVMKSTFKNDIETRITSLSGTDKELSVDLRTWLKEKLLSESPIDIGDEFLRNNLLLPLLSATNIVEQKNILTEIKTKFQKTIFANRICSLLDAKSPSAEITSIQELLKLPEVGAHGDFVHDLNGRLQAMNTSKKETSEKAIVIDTEDWMDIMQCGVEIAGSCQRIDGDPQLNKGLLGYLLDGKIRMVALKSEKGSEGTLMARALIKLLWDGKKPVLLLERIYANQDNPLHKEALLEMAKRKAKNLGVPLVSFEYSGQSYGEFLRSLEGPASFEYSDAARGVKSRGIYTIKGAKIIDT